MGIVINNFSSGWQNKARRELMQETALFVCEDLDIDDLGSLRCRMQHSEEAYFATLSGTQMIYDLFQLDVEGDGHRLIFYRRSNNLYCYDSYTRDTRTLARGVDSTKWFSYAPLKPILSSMTYVYITNGVTMLCDNGASTYTWGIDPPDNLPIVAMQGSGGLLTAGGYSYRYTFYDSATGTESDPSVASATTTAVDNDEALVSQIQVSPNPRVDMRRIYRTLVDGGTWYLAGVLNDNVTTAYYDGVIDANLTTELDTDQGVPPVGSIVVSYKDRLFMTGDQNYPNRVYFSDAEKPDMWPSTYYLDIGTSDDKVVNMVEFEGKLYFMQTATITGLYGSDPDTYSWHKTRSHVGVKAPRSVAAGPDGIYFVSHNGVYRFDGLKSVSISDPIDKIFNDYGDDYTELVYKKHIEAYTQGVFFQGKYYLSVPVWQRGYSVRINRVLVYDVFAQTWLKYMTDPDCLFADEGRGYLYGSVVSPTSSKFSIYELYSVPTHTDEFAGSYQKPAPFFITKSYNIAPEGKAVGWIRKFRVDCQGSWTLAFYVDGTLEHTETLTNEGASTRYEWYSFPAKLKGRYLYVQITATGYPRPIDYVFNELEIA